MATSLSFPSLGASGIPVHIDECCHVLKDGVQGIAMGLFQSFL